MTKAEAIALYHSGLEPTVAKLLELAATKEQLERQLQKLVARDDNAQPVDPARPSAMTPAYEKPSSKSKRLSTMVKQQNSMPCVLQTAKDLPKMFFSVRFPLP